MICLTDFHNIGEIFDKPQGFFVSFQNISKSGDFEVVLKHTPAECPQNIFKELPVLYFDHLTGTKSFDPITGYAYSVENDIEFFILDCECRFGRALVTLNNVIPLRIKSWMKKRY